MTLKELKDIINQVSDEEANSLTVAIPLREFSLGPSAFEEIKTTGRGFDWDTGKYFLFPANDLMHHAENHSNSTPKRKIVRVINEATICRCPSCNIDIDTIDRFCKNCGQKFKE